MHRVDGERAGAAGIRDVEVHAVDHPAVKRQGRTFRERGRLALTEQAGDPGGRFRRRVHELDRRDLAGALLFGAFGRGDRDVGQFHQGEVRLAVEHAETVEFELGGLDHRRNGRLCGRLHLGFQGLDRVARIIVGHAVAIGVHVGPHVGNLFIRRAGNCGAGRVGRQVQDDIIEDGLVAVDLAARERQTACAGLSQREGIERSAGRRWVSFMERDVRKVSGAEYN